MIKIDDYCFIEPACISSV